jgi:hypothetical protein
MYNGTKRPSRRSVNSSLKARLQKKQQSKEALTWLVTNIIVKTILLAGIATLTYFCGPKVGLGTLAFICFFL